MPFMLKACGHALRYSKPDGVCGRCTVMEVDGNHESVDSDMRINAENIEPVRAVTAEALKSKKPFLDQVGKMLGVMVNSEGPEMTDAVTHVARHMSTFTAGERSDFVYELVIKFCEARREDQPKIDMLLKELAKKNVLAKPHFIQSAKRVIAETANLVVDLPNIYDCTVDLIGTCLSLLKNPNENLEAFAKLLKNAPSDHAHKYCLQLRRHFPAVHVADTKGDKHPPGGASSTRQAVGFFLSPTAAKDKFIRPVGQRPPRQCYSREVMLLIEANSKKIALPEKVMELIDGLLTTGPRELQLLKRPRFVSESGTGGEPGSSTKRMLESTSPPLLMASPQKMYGQKDFQASPSSVGVSLTGFDRPRFVSESADKLQSGPTYSASPKKSYHEHPYASHAQRESGTKPRYNSFGSPKTDQPARTSPPRQLTTLGAAAAPATPGERPTQPTTPNAASRPASGKTKKFLTALNVERITETDVGQLSPTLSPNVKTWSRGSGSLNATAKPNFGLGGTSPSKDTGKASSPLNMPRPLAMSHHNNHYHHAPHRGSPSGNGDHQRTPTFASSGGAPKMESENNWRRGLSQA